MSKGNSRAASGNSPKSSPDKDPLRLPFFNQIGPVWDGRWKWISPDGFELTEPRWLRAQFWVAYEGLRQPGDPMIDDWSAILPGYYSALRRAIEYQSNSYFAHFWASRSVQWQGYALFDRVWHSTMKLSEGTELTYPHAQRVEPNDASRIKEADRLAATVESSWTSQFL